MLSERATAIGSAPIEAGWSTITSTGPCSASVVNTCASAASSLGSGRSCSRLPAGLSAHAWCSALPTSRPQNTAYSTAGGLSGSDKDALLARRGRPTRTPAPAATLRADHASGSGLYQRSLAPSDHGDNTPQIIDDRGRKSYRGRWPATPRGADQEGNGVRTPGGTGPSTRPRPAHA